MSTSNEEPPPKRQKFSSNASGPITLNVGGTKFITSSSTLKHQILLILNLFLSDNWVESKNNGDDEIFIDQDPEPFKILLGYMRRGNIKVEDIDTDVLALAEFLGIERLLLAVKVRWYHNIGKRSVLTTADEIAAAFDTEHGGVRNAIAAGLFPLFRKQDDVNADKDYAILTITKVDGSNRRLITVNEVPGPKEETEAIVGALNGLHLKGYVFHEKQLDKYKAESKETFTISRRRHSTMCSDATNIFIPDGHERSEHKGRGSVKQFAIAVSFRESGDEIILAPAEFNEDESKRSNPYGDTIITQCDTWLENNGFVTREENYEDMFQHVFKDGSRLMECKIFSRNIVPM